VRQLDSSGTITTLVGNGTPGFAGDGGPLLEAQLNLPMGSNPPPAGTIALDGDDLYIADTLNHRIRLAHLDDDLIETAVGNGQAGFGGDGGDATEASINNPRDLGMGPDGRLYIADELNHRIRAYDPDTGLIETVAGTGEATFSGDGGPATAAALNRPAGVAFQGPYLYISDTFNHRIRRVRLFETQE
jgi:sugar lactone lactonase YvrE